MQQTWHDIGIHIPQICIPAPGIELKKWSVIACDQYTSQPDYWEQVKQIVGDAPSTLNLVLPEIWLDTPEQTKRTIRIQEKMKTYIEQGILHTLEPGAVLVERKIEGRTRHGLVLAIDLEQYDFSSKTQSRIRATEGTIESRIPPRLSIRQEASLEFPHVLLLIDDPDCLAIERLVAQSSQYQVLYDFELMLGGGRITGRMIPEHCLDELKSAFYALEERSVSQYGQSFLFSVGDGNHSLATAKVSWENIKKTISVEERENHPARFALVEIENIHDQGIVFEPIHRVLFNIPDGKEAELSQLIESKKGSHTLPLGELQNALDEFLLLYPDVRIDYVHGETVAQKLGDTLGCQAFVLPSMEKSTLFASVAKDGPLPRKAFSMGEANEKRYYLEGKKIR